MAYNNEYHTEKELKRIQKWPTKDINGLIEHLRKIWNYENYFVTKWGRDTLFGNRQVLIVEMHTGGWSGNEGIIEALEKNKSFWFMWWFKSERGGHYYFEVDFRRVGFLSVSEYCKKNDISRQYVSQAKDKFEFIEISKHKRLVRLKTN